MKKHNDIIHEVLTQSHLNKKEKDNLRKELESHFFERENDLLIKGKNEEKCTPEQSFGNTKKIASEITLVHSLWSKEKKVQMILLFWWIFCILQYLFSWFFQSGGEQTLFEFFFFVLLSPLFFAFATLISVLFIWINPFFLSLFAVNILLFASLHIILTGVRRLFHTLTSKLRNQFLMLLFSFTQILHWFALIFSYRELPAAQKNLYEHAVGGFPFQVFVYPHPPMGSDMVPIAMWPDFYEHYFFWMAIAAILSVVLLKKKKINPDHIQYIFICGIILFFFGISYTLFKFD